VKKSRLAATQNSIVKARDTPGEGKPCRRANQTANGKWQSSNGFLFAICPLPFEF
jgi:hypothetical protein